MSRAGESGDHADAAQLQEQLQQAQHMLPRKWHCRLQGTHAKQVRLPDRRVLLQPVEHGRGRQPQRGHQPLHDDLQSAKRCAHRFGWGREAGIPMLRGPEVTHPSTLGSKHKCKSCRIALQRWAGHLEAGYHLVQVVGCMQQSRSGGRAMRQLGWATRLGLPASAYCLEAFRSSGRERNRGTGGCSTVLRPP